MWVPLGAALAHRRGSSRPLAAPVRSVCSLAAADNGVAPRSLAGRRGAVRAMHASRQPRPAPLLPLAPAPRCSGSQWWRRP